MERKTQSEVYFTISNYLTTSISILDIAFNVSLDLGASIDPSNPQKESNLQERINLGSVIVENPDEQIGLWENELVLIIPSKSTQSFKFEYKIDKESLREVNNYAYHISASYINPSNGGLGFLNSEIRINNE